MAKRWNYCGDINLRYGGFFWQESGYADHVYCVDVIPCSDMGGPDNLFIIEKGSIYLPLEDAERVKSALDVIGMTSDEAKRFDLIYAFKAYGGQDVDCRETVQIGKRDEFYDYDRGGFDMPEIDRQLRANAKLKNYVRREFLN